MSSTTYKQGTQIDRKSLKQPDELTSGLQQFFDGLAANGIAVVVMIAVITAVVGGVVLFMNHREARQEAAGSALFSAQKLLDDEAKTIAEAKAPAPAASQAKETPPAAKGKEASKAPEKAPADPESVAYDKLDVDARFGPAVEKLKTVVQDFHGTRASYEAAVALGALYLNHGSADKALPWYERATQEAPGNLERATAWEAYGQAEEALGKSSDAIQAFEKAQGQGQAGMKGDLLLAIARNQELMKDAAKARGTYDQIITQLPGTEAARQAEAYKSLLSQ